MYTLNRRQDCPSNFGCTNDKPRGVTLIELVIVIAIIFILAGIAYPVYIGHQEKARNTRAIAEVRSISLEIIKIIAFNDIGPDTLAEVNYGSYLDPWGNPYQFYNIKTAKGNGSLRKDKFLVPINSDFDLYSMGKNGLSTAPLNAPASKDDIIRANDGQYVGLAIAF